MAHDISRLLRAFAHQAWFIEPRRAEQIVSILAFRAANGVRAEAYRADGGAEAPAVSSQQGSVAILRLYGPILPRAEAVTDLSAPAALLTQFQQAFKQAANDPNVGAIVLDIDSPGGQVDLVPETAQMIRKARRSDRPIVAIADTLACSAAYWIACSGDSLSVTPSGEVGSIGVYCVHEDLSDMLTAEGVKVTMVSEGARKTEGNPFEPLSPEALAYLQDNVRTYYDMFAADVAKGRGVPVSTVKADPESTDTHFGGGRSYTAKKAVALGMADTVETLDDLVTRLQRGLGGKRASSRASAHSNLAGLAPT